MFDIKFGWTNLHLKSQFILDWKGIFILNILGRLSQTCK